MDMVPTPHEISQSEDPTIQLYELVLSDGQNMSVGKTEISSGGFTVQPPLATTGSLHVRSYKVT